LPRFACTLLTLKKSWTNSSPINSFQITKIWYLICKDFFSFSSIWKLIFFFWGYTTSSYWFFSNFFFLSFQSKLFCSQQKTHRKDHNDYRNRGRWILKNLWKEYNFFILLLQYCVTLSSKFWFCIYVFLLFVYIYTHKIQRWLLEKKREWSVSIATVDMVWSFMICVFFSGFVRIGGSIVVLYVIRL